MHMHIFEGARHLSNSEWVIRAIIAYIFLILVAKAMGQRSIAQLRFLDVVLVLLLGGNISNALSDEKVGLMGSMITTFILVVLHIISSVLMLKWDRWRRFLEPAPIILIHNGSIDFSNLKKARITVEYLFFRTSYAKCERYSNDQISIMGSERCRFYISVSRI